MFYDFAVTVPAGTPENAPVEQDLKLTTGLIVRVDVEFPAGCRGYVSVVIMAGGHQLYPTNPEGALNAEDFTVSAWDFYPMLQEPLKLKAKAWSPDADYDHVLTVRVDLVRIEELTKLLPFLQGLEKLLEYMGVPTGEEEAAAAEELPPEEEEIIPVCVIGETKCEDGNLYECQEVEGEAAWVLTEENSPQCKAVQPPPDEPEEPTPEPPPEPLPEPSEGEIQSINWVEIDGTEHPLTDPIPQLVGYYQRFKIRNTGKVAADFRVAYYTTGFGEGYHYSKKVNLVPDQVAYIDWVFYAGAKPGSYTVTWHLFSYDLDVYQLEATHTISAEETK